MNDSSNFTEILNLIETVLQKLPIALGKKMKEEITKIKEFTMDSREPRLMIIGRRGAGKSSLLNAIFNEKLASVGSVTSETGKASWYSYKTSRGMIELLDTRGLGDRTRPESANFNEAIDDIFAAIENISPDALLFLCKAKEVDARIADDISNVKTIIQYMKNKHKYDPPIIGIVTQVDELDPLSDSMPPYPKKEKNINLSVNALEDAFRTNDLKIIKIIPTSSYAEYDENDKIIYNKFWNIDVLVNYMVDVLPREAQVQLARMTAIRSAQEKACRALIHSVATVTAGIAVVPIPVADIIPITALQVGLITFIGYISGRKLSSDNAKEFLAAAGVNVGGAFLLRETARALVKIVFPGYGSVISAGVAYAGTWAIGEAAIAYYINGRDINEAKRIMKEIFDRKKKEKEEEKGKE